VENSRKKSLTKDESVSNRIPRRTVDTKYDYLQGFDVHTIVEKYGNQLELLELILSCKVQEDKRKTEEAKLKQREIDYLISNEGTFIIDI
jgi:hypothetical protein